jgi:hypothetical protein
MPFPLGALAPPLVPANSLAVPDGLAPWAQAAAPTSRRASFLRILLRERARHVGVTRSTSARGLDPLIRQADRAED